MTDIKTHLVQSTLFSVEHLYLPAAYEGIVEKGRATGLSVVVLQHLQARIIPGGGDGRKGAGSGSVVIHGSPELVKRKKLYG